MAKLASRLFAIAPGEEKKTTLLYALHFVVFLGQSWGSLAALTLFLDNWPAEDLAFMFIGSAVIMFVVGLAYSSFADRISHFRLLMVIVAITALWLLSVRVLLVTNGGPYGIVYPYYYLGYDLVRDVSVLHLLTYTNSFFNTRSAKHAMPIVLSGGLAGNMVAGFTVALVANLLGMENIPLVWLTTLCVSVGIIFTLQRQFHSRADDSKTAQAKPNVQQEQGKPSGLRSLQEGYAYVRSSTLLRWLALAAFGMMLLMNVLMFQSSEIFQARYAGNPEGLLQFYGIFTGLSSLLGVIIQTFFISRLITAIGVGNSSMIFPAVTGIAVTLLGVFPSFLTAIFGSITQISLRRAVQTPIDAIIYNCLPPEVKGRSRAFILGLVVPLGALAGGLLLLSVRQGMLSATALTIAGIIIAGIYVLSMLRVRGAYGLAFAQLLADGEMAFLSSGQDAFARPDPSVVNSLTERLDAADSPEMTVFLAEMLYELQGPASFEKLHEIFRSGDATVQSELIRVLSAEWGANATVSAMCQEGLQSNDSRVCIAAAQTLAAQPDIHTNSATLHGFRSLATSDDDNVRAAVLPTLLTSENVDDQALAQESMAVWLSPEANRVQRTLVLNVLAKAGDEALLDRLTPFMTDPEPTVRLQALRLIGNLIEGADGIALRNYALSLVFSFLNDKDDFVRLAALKTLGDLGDETAGPPLWPLLSDDIFAVRRQTCLSFPKTMESELQTAVSGDDPVLAESAAYILVDKMDHVRLASTINDIVNSLADDMITLLTHTEAMRRYDSASGRLLSKALSDHIDEMSDQAYWLIGALCSHAEADSIRRLLVSRNDSTRANAAEALESVTSPATSRKLISLSERHASTSTLMAHSSVTADEVIRYVWPEYETGAHQPPLSRNLRRFYDRQWLKAVGIYVIVNEQIAQSGARLADRGPADGGQDDSDTVRAKRNRGRKKTAAWDLLDKPSADEASLPMDNAVSAALSATAKDDRALVQEAVAWANVQRSSQSGESSRKADNRMLTVIEKVLFLKEVPFFADMSIDQLRILAAISEELDSSTDETIVKQGEDANTLYVVVQGKVAVQNAQTTARGQVSVRRLTTLNRGDYFGEMSIFDGQPFGSSVVAIRPTKLLSVSQASLLALIELHPDMGLSLLRVFSLRLRDFMALAEERTAVKPKQLMDLYDQFD